MRLRTALLATTLIASAPVAAMADTITGPYISLGAGYDLQMTEGVHYSPTGFAGGEPDGVGSPFGGASKARLAFKDGVTGFGTVGYGLGNGIRVELEGNYVWDELNKRHGTFAPGNSQGHTESYGPLVNVLYDIDLTRFGINLPVTPYVGVGAGYLWTHLSPISTYYTNGDVNRTGGTNGSFAYQGIIGVAYNVVPVPGLALTADYRFLGQTNEGNFTSTSYAPNGLHIVNADANDAFHHEFTVGLRYAFNAAPPPPPPAPAPVVAPAPTPARTYLVFFDWDKSYLTPRARQIVAEAAQNSTRVQTTSIEVNGYADTSHALPGRRGQEYNLRLSLRRADSVKAELIRDGVPAGVISVHGYGDTHLLVPTGPNAREPQNRRVEIILH
jgi:OmpA-OmpF porin, OOP family